MQFINFIIIYEEIIILTYPLYLFWIMIISQSFFNISQYMILQTLYHPGSRAHAGSPWPQPALPVVKRSSACALSSYSLTLWPLAQHCDQMGLSRWQTTALEGSWGWARQLCHSLVSAGSPRRKKCCHGGEKEKNAEKKSNKATQK